MHRSSWALAIRATDGGSGRTPTVNAGCREDAGNSG
jgi:hypothetical protein